MLKTDDADKQLAVPKDNMDNKKVKTETKEEAYEKKIINLKNLGDYTNTGPGRQKPKDKDDGINITPDEIIEAVEHIRSNNKRKKLPKMKGDKDCQNTKTQDNDCKQETKKTMAKSVKPIKSEDCAEPEVVVEQHNPYNPLPLSSGGLSAGADDPTVGILDLSATPTPQYIDLDNFQSFNAIQN